MAGATTARGRLDDVSIERAPRTKAIEDIRVGERVLGSNPLADGPLAAQHEALPDPATWKKVVLCLNEPGFGRLDMTFIQPPEWFVETGARIGGTVELDLPELGAEGDAKVLSIGPCPPIEPGDGAIVTGTFVHRSAGNLVDVRFEGVDEPNGVTDNHLYFSLDRNEFVEAGRLRRGERVDGAIEGDALRVSSVTRRPADELVYNLQVNGQHVYHVGSHGALVHNMCGRAGKQTRLRELMADHNLSSALRGWLKQEVNRIFRGAAKRIRVPPGMNLAHRRGFEARKGYSYKYSDLQDKSLHDLQHQFEGINVLDIE